MTDINDPTTTNQDATETVTGGDETSPLMRNQPALGATLLGGDVEEERQVRPLRDPVPADAHGWWWGVGRRKAAVARVRIKPTSSDAKVQVQVTRKQFKSVDEYWPGERDRFDVFSPLRVTDTLGKLDVFIRCDGGGTMGQAQAARLGIARALVGYDPQLENVLREHGFLTRDARKVERKKYGQPGARRRYQFSKR